MRALVWGVTLRLDNKTTIFPQYEILFAQLGGVFYCYNSFLMALSKRKRAALLTFHPLDENYTPKSFLTNLPSQKWTGKRHGDEEKKNFFLKIKTLTGKFFILGEGGGESASFLRIVQQSERILPDRRTAIIIIGIFFVVIAVGLTPGARIPVRSRRGIFVILLGVRVFKGVSFLIDLQFLSTEQRLQAEQFFLQGQSLRQSCEMILGRGIAGRVETETDFAFQRDTKEVIGGAVHVGTSGFGREKA